MNTELSIKDALLCICLADRIHETEEAVIATAYRVRERVANKHKPAITRIIRSGDARKWVQDFLKVVNV